jgi:hypothetical protein
MRLQLCAASKTTSPSSSVVQGEGQGGGVLGMYATLLPITNLQQPLQQTNLDMIFEGMLTQTNLEMIFEGMLTHHSGSLAAALRPPSP